MWSDNRTTRLNKSEMIQYCIGVEATARWFNKHPNTRMWSRASVWVFKMGLQMTLLGPIYEYIGLKPSLPAARARTLVRCASTFRNTT